jgi:hypothetical protein
MVNMNKRLYAYMTYLIIVTLVVTAVSMSRYATMVTGSEEVGVAKVVIQYEPISATLNGNAINSVADGITVSNVLPADVLEYHFSIKNYAGDNLNQVLMKYRIIINIVPNPTQLPLTYILTPDDIYHSASGEWTYMGYGEKETHNYTLTVTWEENEDDPSYKSKEQSIQIQIDSEQVDSFE